MGKGYWQHFQFMGPIGLSLDRAGALKLLGLCFFLPLPTLLEARFVPNYCQLLPAPKGERRESTQVFVPLLYDFP